jgi:hypothetical protein
MIGITFLETAPSCINFWAKPFDEILCIKLPKRFDKSTWKKLFIILGGDHGQGAFQLVVTVIVYSSDGDEVYEEVFRLGEIVCQTLNSCG